MKGTNLVVPLSTTSTMASEGQRGLWRSAPSSALMSNFAAEEELQKLRAFVRSLCTIYKVLFRYLLNLVDLFDEEVVGLDAIHCSSTYNVHGTLESVKLENNQLRIYHMIFLLHSLSAVMRLSGTGICFLLQCRSRLLVAVWGNDGIPDGCTNDRWCADSSLAAMAKLPSSGDRGKQPVKQTSATNIWARLLDSL